MWKMYPYPRTAANMAACRMSAPAKLPRRFSAGASLRVSCWVAIARVYFWFRGWVTMLMLVTPACLIESMTEAKAPKGTRSSART